MTRNPTRSILGSLKGRIWFAVSGLAVVNCVIGVTVFFLSSYVIADRNLSAFLAFLVAGFVTVVFGGWLSNDVLDPLNKDMMGMLFATEAMMGEDEYCMEYIGAFREGIFVK